MTTKRTKEHKLLNKFLRENKCKRKYYRNCKNDPSQDALAIMELNFTPSFISGAFTWGVTPEGHEYWLDICKKWESYHNKHLR